MTFIGPLAGWFVETIQDGGFYRDLVATGFGVWLALKADGARQRREHKGRAAALATVLREGLRRNLLSLNQVANHASQKRTAAVRLETLHFDAALRDAPELLGPKAYGEMLDAAFALKFLNDRLDFVVRLEAEDLRAELDRDAYYEHISMMSTRALEMVDHALRGLQGAGAKEDGSA